MKQPLSTTRSWICVSDFDGTISTIDATDRLLELHADPAWLEIEQIWKSGLIGSRECLARQVELLRVPISTIEKVASSVEIDPKFRAFADFCRRNGVTLVIVSDGLDRLINPILKRNGLAHIPVFSNVLLPIAPCAYTLVSPYREETCSAQAGTCKCAVIEQVRDDARASHVLYVGDGRSDFCAAARSSDAIAAKASLAKYLDSLGTPYTPYSDFDDVRALLARLIRQPASRTADSEGEVYERQ